MNDCSGGNRIGRIDDYLVGFGDAAQNFGLDAEVASGFDVAEFDNTL